MMILTTDSLLFLPMSDNSKKEKIKVLFVSHTSNLGGAEIVLLRFLENVSNFIPMVFLPKGDLALQIKKKHFLTESKYLGKLNKSNNVFWPFLFFFRFFMSQFEIGSIIKKNNPDLIQCNTFYSVIYCLLISRLFRKPLIWHMHDFIGPRISFKYIAKLYEIFCSEIIAVSQAVKKDLILNGVSEEKITVIYNSITRDQLAERKSARKVEKFHQNIENIRKSFSIIAGVLGSIEERKGFLQLAEAFNILKQETRKKIALLIGGEPKDKAHFKYHEKLIKYLESNNLNTSVFLLGQINDIGTFYENIDLFIHYPYLPDPFPTVILEAIAMDCPVIASDNGGNPECVKFGQWGTIVPSNEPEKLANELTLFKKKSLAKNQRNKFFKCFSHSKKEKMHLELYHKILGK